MGRRDIDAKLDQIITKLDQILRQEYHMNRTIDEVLAEVDRQTTQETSMEALLNGLQTIIIQAKGDPGKINAGVTVFVSIKTNEHNEAWMRKFATVVEDLTEVVEFYRMSGDVDYLLRVVVPDIAAYDAFYKRMIAKIEIRDVSSVFAMEQIKYSTQLPLDYMLLDTSKSNDE